MFVPAPPGTVAPTIAHKKVNVLEAGSLQDALDSGSGCGCWLMLGAGGLACVIELFQLALVDCFGLITLAAASCMQLILGVAEWG